MLRENTIDRLSLDEIKKMLDEGMKILPHTVLEKELAELNGIMLQIVDWEQSASQCFKTETQHKISEIENLLERAHLIEDFLPSHSQLKDALQKSKEWLHAIESLERNENYSFFHTLQNIANRAKLLPMEEERQKLFESMGADSEGKLSLSSFSSIDMALNSGLKRKKINDVDEVIKKIKDDPCITELDEQILKAQILCWNNKSKVSALGASSWYTSVDEKFGDSKIVYHCGKCSELAKKKRIKQYQEEKRETTDEQTKPDIDVKSDLTYTQDTEIHETFDDFDDEDNDDDDQLTELDRESDRDSENSRDEEEEGAGDAFIGDSEDSSTGQPSNSFCEIGSSAIVTSQQGKSHKPKAVGNTKGDNYAATSSAPSAVGPRGSDI